MAPTVEPIADAKTPILGTAHSSRENDLAGAFLQELLDEPRHVIRSVLPIAIHDQYCIAGPIGVDEAQADGDGALVAQVAAQAQTLHAPEILEFALDQIRQRRTG